MYMCCMVCNVYAYVVALLSVTQTFFSHHRSYQKTKSPKENFNAANEILNLFRLNGFYSFFSRRLIVCCCAA